MGRFGGEWNGFSSATMPIPHFILTLSENYALGIHTTWLVSLSEINSHTLSGDSLMHNQNTIKTARVASGKQRMDNNESPKPINKLSFKVRPA